MQEWRKEPPILEDVAEFLCLNPSVGTFQWAELVDRAKKDCERGKIGSVSIPKARLLTTLRKRAYGHSVQRNPGKAPSEFNTWYGVAAVQHLIILGAKLSDEMSEEQAFIEFLLSQEDAEEHIKNKTRSLSADVSYLSPPYVFFSLLAVDSGS